MRNPDPFDELRKLYPPLLTTAQVAEMMHCTIVDVRDKETAQGNAVGSAVPLLREEVFAAMPRVGDDEDGDTDRDQL
jgi:hypothetical protein